MKSRPQSWLFTIFKKEVKMTLQQLKYVVTVAEKGTLSDAAKELFISQPALTKDE